MEWSIYNHLYYSKKAGAYLLYSSLSNMLVELDEDGYNDILEIRKNPDEADIKKSQYDFLLDGRFVVRSNENEMNKLMLTMLTQRFNPRTLSLTIAPTRFCNFGCPYCYEKDKRNKKMNKKVQEGILDFVKKYKMVNFLNVVWYGGEPTMATDAVKFLSVELQKLVEHYSAFMVTNGYYLDRIIDTIDELKISGLQITLDGTKETHDQTRSLTNGKGSFDKILTNIDTLLSKHKVNVSIRMNISTTNSGQYAPLFRLLRERYGKKVHLYPAFVYDYGGGCQADTCYDDSYKKAVFLKNLYEEEGLYTRDLYPFRMSKGCMSQQQNSFLIGPEGELYKCWHHLGIKEKEVGSIFADKIITNYGLLSDMMVKGDVLYDNQCKSCVLFPSCNGGCSDNKKNSGEYECIPAKEMLEDFLDIRHFVRERK